MCFYFVELLFFPSASWPLSFLFLSLFCSSSSDLAWFMRKCLSWVGLLCMDTLSCIHGVGRWHLYWACCMEIHSCPILNSCSLRVFHRTLVVGKGLVLNPIKIIIIMILIYYRGENITINEHTSCFNNWGCSNRRTKPFCSLQYRIQVKTCMALVEKIPILMVVLRLQQPFSYQWQCSHILRLLTLSLPIEALK